MRLVNKGDCDAVYRLLCCSVQAAMLHCTDISKCEPRECDWEMKASVVQYTGSCVAVQRAAVLQCTDFNI